ncbi:MAG: alpha/beta hydrolase [Pseudomonadota bacterium]
MGNSNNSHSEGMNMIKFLFLFSLATNLYFSTSKASNEPREPSPQELAEASAFLNKNNVPLPESWKFERVDLSEHGFIRTGGASPEDPPATILFVPGYTSSQEYVSDLLTRWFESGLEVFSMDLPGQGDSIRRDDDFQKPYTGDWAYYGRAVTDFVAQLKINRISKGPLIVIGQSMGGHAVVRSAHEGGLAEVDAIIPLVPAFYPYTEDEESLMQIRELAASAVNNGLGGEYVQGDGPWYPTKFKPESYAECGKREDRIFKNEALYRLNKYLRVGGPTYEYIDGLFSSTHELLDSNALRSLNVPVFMITAGTEVVVQNNISYEICAKSIAGCTLTEIADATHCIHIDAEEVQLKLQDLILDVIDQVS